MSRAAGIRRRRAIADVAIQVGGRAVNLIPGVIVTLLLARTLGDSGFGQWSTLFAVLQIASYIGDFGLEQVAVRRVAAEPEREREWLGALLTLRLAIAVPVTLGCAAAQLVIADSAEMLAAGLLVSGTLVMSALSVTRAAFQLRVRNDLSVLVLTVNTVLWTAAVVAIAARDEDMVAFAAAFLAASLASTLLGLWLALRISPLRLRNSSQLWRELARVGIPVGIAGMLVTAYVKLDQVLLFALAGADEAGLYGAAYRILDQAQFVPIAVMTTLFPIIAGAWPADPHRVRRIAQLVVDYLAMVSLPALAFTVAAAEPLVLLLFGPEFRDAADALPILMAAFVVICFGYLSGNLVIVLALQRLFLLNAAIALVFNVALNVVLIPPYGFVAAAWVTLATEVLVTLLTLRVALARIELAVRPRRMLLAAVAATAMALAVWLADSNGAGVGVLFAVGATVYPVALLATGALRVADVRELLDLRRDDTGSTPASGA